MLIPFPIIGPTRYVDRWHDSGTSSAVHSLQQSQDRNHRELMGAVKEMGGNKLAVTVVATEILPSATAAFNYLDGPCRDYDKAYEKWSSRYYKVKSYLRKRKKRPEENKKKAEIEAYRAKHLKRSQERDADEHVRRNSSWFRGLPFHEAFKLVEERKVPTPNVDKVLAWEPEDENDFYQSMTRMYRLQTEMDMEMIEMKIGPYGKSAPVKPDGHDQLSDIREVYESATAAPNAMLTIPADTVRAIGKFANLSGNVVEDRCDSCGSKNFLRIGAVRVCSYCRSET